ncbi:MAG TPA: hypothetical protein VI432_03060 [Candidatus Paceibacterota bacterium]
MERGARIEVDRRILDRAQYPFVIEERSLASDMHRITLVDIGIEFDPSVDPIERLLKIMADLSKQQGMRKATEGDVLALCAHNPDLARRFCVVASGAILGAKSSGSVGQIYPLDVLCLTDVGEGQFVAGLRQYAKILTRLDQTNLLMPIRVAFACE